MNNKPQELDNMDVKLSEMGLYILNNNSEDIKNEFTMSNNLFDPAHFAMDPAHSIITPSESQINLEQSDLNLEAIENLKIK
ncbi:MAG: hypothetical protein ATN32_06705 [Candidatus Epulonipiscium fishelsonii]|nr:MAG: hypothetical protein ATN32_06705 [Epulopiscium sp. AS2M-Bin002]